MSIRTIVEFNNDYVEDLRKNGHISSELLDIILRTYPEECLPTIQGVVVKDAVHHSTGYSIVYGPHRQNSTAI